jgi:hypothetical protein
MQGHTPLAPFQHDLSPFVIEEPPKPSPLHDNLMGTPRTESGSPSTMMMEDLTMGMENLNTPPKDKRLLGTSKKKL